MEYQKITNLLGTTSDEVSRFFTKNWIEVHDQSGNAENRYNPKKQRRLKTSMLRSDLCDYSNAYIVGKGNIIVTNPCNDAYHKKLTFENNALFTSYISKINDRLIGNAEDLDIVMPMYNLIEYSKNYRKTTRSLWNYYGDSGLRGDINNINYSLKDSKSFDYKTSITGKVEGNNVEKDDVKIVVKYLSNFWKTSDMLLINCEVSLTLTWSKNCVITSKATRDDDPGAYPAVDEIKNTTNAIFKITDCKLYVLLVTLSAENDNKLLEQLKTGFKRTNKWNKYRSEMSNQTKNYNLNYLIDPTFTKVNRLFVLSFENETDRTSFSKYYVPKVEIKDFNNLIDGKPFFEIPIKNKEEAYEQILEMSKNNDYTTGNLLDYEYFSKYYRLIAIDLRKENVAFKTCAPFTRCVTHEAAENLEIIMPMYNLIEYSDNYSDSSGSLYQFKRDESPMNNDGNPLNVALNNLSSFKYKASILGRVTDADGNDRSLKNTKIAVPLKCLSNFFGLLEMPLINCKNHLELNWNNNCVMYGADGNADGNYRETTFKITSTKLYVPVIPLST